MEFTADKGLDLHIQTKQPHNAWLHIVYTDSTNVSLKVFIDSTNQHKKDSPYPFYSFGKDFYDTPIWKYNLLSKPLNYWKGHAWAVTVDRRNKTIKPIGGISWGFKLSYFKLRPELIPLSPLDMQTWESDWLVFQTKLKNFKVNVAAHSSPYCVS